MASGGVVISEQDRGPWVNIISWILLVVTCLATSIKVYSKWSLRHALEADDYYLSGAMIAVIGWVITTSLQIAAGLGRHTATLDATQLVRFQQTAYASHFFYVASICLAKMAILHFMTTLTREKSRQTVVKLCIIFNLITFIAAIFAVAFQCQLPQPWAILSDKCFDQKLFWDAFGTIDIVVDLATVVLPFFLLHDLHLTWGHKLPVMIAFALRAIIIPIIIVRLVLLSNTTTSTDHPYDDFGTAIVAAVHINVSAITTCLPFLKNIIDSLQTGLLAGDVRTRHAPQLYDYHFHSSGKPSVKGSKDGSKAMRSRDLDDKEQGFGGGKVVAKEGRGLHSSESQERMEINHTTTVEVRYMSSTKD